MGEETGSQGTVVRAPPCEARGSRLRQGSVADPHALQGGKRLVETLPGQPTIKPSAFAHPSGLFTAGLNENSFARKSEICPIDGPSVCKLSVQGDDVRNRPMK